MPESSDNLPDYIRIPFKENFLFYSFKYGMDIRALRDAINLIPKAISSRDFDTAINILHLLVSNLKSPPYYILLMPTNARIVDMYYISSKVIANNDWLRARLLTFKIAEPHVVIILYEYDGSIESIGVRLNYIISNGVIYTDLLPQRLVNQLLDMIKNGEFLVNTVSNIKDYRDAVNLFEPSEKEVQSTLLTSGSGRGSRGMPPDFGFPEDIPPEEIISELVSRFKNQQKVERRDKRGSKSSDVIEYTIDTKMEEEE